MRISKLLTLILALLMVLSAFAGCGEGAPNESDSQNGSDTGSSSSNESETETSKYDDILVGVSFPGVVLKVLVGDDCEVSEYVETLEEKSDVLDQATFNRCDFAENRLQIRTKWSSAGSVGESGEGIIETAERENSNGGTYDIIASKSSWSAPMMTHGVFSNLLKYPHFDFEEDGWAKTLIEDVSVGNKLYVATGDISVNLLFMTSVVFFNKGLVEDLNINTKIQSHADWEASNLYELVEKGKWTLDKLITLSENVYKDGGISGKDNGKKDSGDRFGFNTYKQLLENFYYGGGYTTIVAEGDSFGISESYLSSDLMGDLLSQVNNFLHETKDGIIEEGSKPYDPTRLNFAAGNILFCMAPASHAYNTHSKAAELNYSVLPVPKHSESQESYACTQSFPYMLYSIASHAHNPVPASAFMQALAIESYTTTRPTILDTMMKGRYAEDPKDAKMWEYAIDANTFDVGRIFQDLFKEESTGKIMTVDLIRDRILEDKDSWTHIMDTYSEPLVYATVDLATKITKLPD
ncbi:MAG: hypothetical protein IJD75_06345 [Clostridia bacterium]|nr:hypothetical protein [Clostridia bacterium]MBQ3014734.1 hypothetical protein [Clostridia bacterium]